MICNIISLQLSVLQVADYVKRTMNQVLYVDLQML